MGFNLVFKGLNKLENKQEHCAFIERCC